MTEGASGPLFSEAERRSLHRWLAVLVISVPVATVVLAVLVAVWIVRVDWPIGLLGIVVALLACWGIGSLVVAALLWAARVILVAHLRAAEARLGEQEEPLVDWEWELVDEQLWELELLEREGGAEQA